uniref:Uncharacterized protein n=1 Tax=viral metagenome TaxID=1070528 RepID=A0A6M3LR63_9ZZZZ
MKDKAIFYVDGATTVCLLRRDGDIVARGISIHSRLDEWDGAEGRKYARDRANEALGRKRDCAPIDLDAKRADGVFVDKIRMQLAIDRFGYFKGYYHPNLTPTEYLVLSIKDGHKS